MPTCTSTAATTVTFTTVGGAYSITLPGPKFDNQETFDPHIILHRTRSGDLYVYKRGSPLRGMQFVFYKMKKDKYDSLITFLTNSAGLKVTYVNHFGVSYVGVIRTPQFRENGRELGFEVSFTFEIA